MAPVRLINNRTLALAYGKIVNETARRVFGQNYKMLKCYWLNAEEQDTSRIDSWYHSVVELKEFKPNILVASVLLLERADPTFPRTATPWPTVYLYSLLIGAAFVLYDAEGRRVTQLDRLFQTASIEIVDDNVSVFVGEKTNQVAKNLVLLNKKKLNQSVFAVDEIMSSRFSNILAFNNFKHTLYIQKRSVSSMVSPFVSPSSLIQRTDCK